MADDYWIDIVHHRPGKKAHVGADDYYIEPRNVSNHIGDRSFAAVGKKYRLAAEVETVGGTRHHHGSRSQRYWNQPLFYTVDYGEVPVNVSYDDPEVPDDVSGSFVGFAWPAWLAEHIKNATNQDRQRRASFAMAIEEAKVNAQRRLSKKPNDAHLKALYAKLVEYSKPNGVNMRPDDAYWQATPLRKKDHDLFLHRPHKFTLETHGFGADIVHGINAAAGAAGKLISLPGKALSAIPVVGPLIHTALKLDPAKAIGGLAANVMHGERLDHAFLHTAKEQLHAVKEIAPYVSTVMSFVPGVGTGVAAAIAAGTALAEGRTITDAVLQGLAGSVPGGQLGKSVLGAAVAITHGQNVAKATLDAAKANLPPAARQAIDTAVAAAGGKNVRVAVLQALRQQLPADAQKALDIGVAVGAARNIQSHAVSALNNPANVKKLAAKSIPPTFMKAIPKEAGAAAGYRTAMGLLAHKGVTAHAVAAARTTLKPHEVHGFDHAVKVYANHFNPSWTSLVRGGVVTRGAWKSVQAGTKGAIPGRVVQNGRVISGHFIRS